VDARVRRRAASLALKHKALAPVKKLKRKAIAAAAYDEPLRHGPGGIGLRREAARRDNDETTKRGFGWSQNAEHRAVKRARKPIHRGTTLKPEHREQTMAFRTSLLRSMALFQSMVSSYYE
jgi:hypothetical protein